VLTAIINWHHVRESDRGEEAESLLSRCNVPGPGRHRLTLRAHCAEGLLSEICGSSWNESQLAVWPCHNQPIASAGVCGLGAGW
jgi:hypothetical protein